MECVSMKVLMDPLKGELIQPSIDEVVLQSGFLLSFLDRRTDRQTCVVQNGRYRGSEAQRDRAEVGVAERRWLRPDTSHSAGTKGPSVCWLAQPPPGCFPSRFANYRSSRIVYVLGARVNSLIPLVLMCYMFIYM